MLHGEQKKKFIFTVSDLIYIAMLLNVPGWA